jgi:hypothetical protein
MSCTVLQNFMPKKIIMLKLLFYFIFFSALSGKVAIFIHIDKCAGYALC